MQDSRYLTRWGTDIHTYLDNAILKQDVAFQQAARTLTSPSSHTNPDEVLRELYLDQRHKFARARRDSLLSKPRQEIMPSFAELCRAFILGDAHAEKMMEE